MSVDFDFLASQEPAQPGLVDFSFGVTAIEPVLTTVSGVFPGLRAAVRASVRPDLVFDQPAHTGGPAHLVFGAAGAFVPPPPPPPPPIPVTATGFSVLGGVSGYGLTMYDNRNPRRASTSARMPHQPAAQGIAASSLGWGQSARRLDTASAPWGLGAQAAGEPSVPWNVSGRVSSERSAPWALAAQRMRQAAFVHEVARAVLQQRLAPWALGESRDGQAALVHQAAHSLARQAAALWGLSATVQVSARFAHGSGAARLAEMLAPWQTSRPVPPGREVWPKPTPGGITPRVPTTHLLFACPPGWAGSGPVHLVFGRVCGLPPGPAASLVILPARFYMAVHTLTAHRWPDLAALPIFDVSLSADAGSFAWTFSASGPADLFDALAPSAGLPAQIRITLDGIAFVFLVDSLQREERFGKRGTRISGRSATALLARPYARETARLNAGVATAQQLAESVLDATGATIDWGLTDWLVPAGAWSHSGTPLAALQAIVEAAGGYVQSHRTAATLLARHPYPELPGGIVGGPWNWGGAFPADVELAPDAIITSGIERRDGPDINGVYVSGTTQGVIALVKRTGTAADKLASLITDPLITAQEAALQRGLSVLGAAGPKHLVQIELPILTGAGQPGVLDVGQLVQVNATTPWRGRVRSVSVTAAMPKARQTVSLERHLETV